MHVRKTTIAIIVGLLPIEAHRAWLRDQVQAKSGYRQNSGTGKTWGLSPRDPVGWTAAALRGAGCSVQLEAAAERKGMTFT